LFLLQHLIIVWNRLLDAARRLPLQARPGAPANEKEKRWT
jgi:hypothetical protein